MPLTKQKSLIDLLRVRSGTRESRRLILEGPDKQEMSSCRAFRTPGIGPDRFLLVAVAPDVPDDDLQAQQEDWIAHGLLHQGRQYSHLGFTDNQVVAYTPKMIFFFEDEEWTVSRLLDSFGDLKQVYQQCGYGKYSARLHLAFSSTVASLDAPAEFVARIEDHRAADGTIHTDGVGLIRNSFADEICAYHDLPMTTAVFQVRRGGIKGNLVRYPDDVFDNLVGTSEHGPYKIAYRPSMLKFTGGPTQIELVNHSNAPGAAHINIQLILLLSTLGIRLEVFQRLLGWHLNLISDILTSRERAMKCISQTTYDTSKDDENWGQRIYQMVVAGHDLNEPYLRTELIKYQNRQYRRVWHIGGDQVYLKVSNGSGQAAQCVVGDVCVTRMPCFATGDIRKFHAVGDIPELHHLENVVVFSRNAPRSIPDTIASGDLDGDLYLVIYDSSLIPSEQAPPVDRCAAPMMPAMPFALDAMKHEAISAFIKYRGSGILVGTFHNQWVSAAQATPQLADSPLARGLVELNERALDMLKTGADPRALNESFSALLLRYSTMKSAPWNKSNPINALRCQVKKAEDASQAAAPRKPWTPDPSLILRSEDPELWTDLLREAKEVMTDYNCRLRDAIKLDKKYDARDRGHVKPAELLRREFVQRYFGGRTPEERAHERMRASAWYHHAYSNRKVAFAWLGSRYLNEIRADYVRDREIASEVVLRLGVGMNMEHGRQ
ncbi:RNA dependent RNA polymerase-domain-containing protein [Fomes fomentarius]|nr:RNA dependent RNA polymerase-domain-containing protein [Fomes fomentarius]